MQFELAEDTVRAIVKNNTEEVAFYGFDPDILLSFPKRPEMERDLVQIGFKGTNKPSSNTLTKVKNYLHEQF